MLGVTHIIESSMQRVHDHHWKWLFENITIQSTEVLQVLYKINLFYTPGNSAKDLLTNPERMCTMASGTELVPVLIYGYLYFLLVDR